MAFQLNNTWFNLIIWYLIAANIYTYFYYHNWTEDQENGDFDFDRIKRRFFNLMLALLFNIYCFAYLYAIPFSSNFNWVKGVSKMKSSLLFSFANSITADYAPIKILNANGYNLTLLEACTSFIFLTIILSNSIPQIKEK